ncbi:hypothetical protein MANES_11G047666v8 [Manihot esculenta]|uniref:Uncharacterized protein n=1 Tax=Manihot esculenta TaxID=3983 RepID=A0ACB7GVL7_MANES|nr:hypothetical protein MANES_11G047666v8 [Manihot esculenta]
MAPLYQPLDLCYQLEAVVACLYGSGLLPCFFSCLSGLLSSEAFSFPVIPLANRLVTKASSCLIYFSALFISSAREVGGFLLKEPKNSAEVVPFCMASTALPSSSSGICRASVLKRATYSLSDSPPLCLTVSK